MTQQGLSHDFAGDWRGGGKCCISRRVDNIAHGLAGAVLGYCGFRQKAGRVALWTSIAASQFPDSDIVLLAVNSATYLRWHRGPTHSLLLLPFWAALIAWVFWELGGRKQYRLLWLTAALSLGLHLGMDWITSYGTLLLWPLRDTRFALSWVFILDPYVWATLGLALWAVRRTQRASPAWTGLAILGVYVLLNGVGHTLTLRAAARLPGTLRVAVYPVPLRPLEWTVVRETADGIHWVSGTHNDTFVSFHDDRLCPQAEATDAVKLFRWFAEFPLVEKLESPGQTVLRYRDLRFRTPLPWGEVREGAFITTEAVFDGQDRLQTSYLAGDNGRR